MAINQNHLFDELNGIKCAIVEKNVPKERVDFLEHILVYNNYKVIVVSSPAPKIAPVKQTEPLAELEPVTVAAAVPETFTIGVTEVAFNAVNAIFGRLLKAPGGHIVTLAYWQQKDNFPNDEIPYFDHQPASL
ncbi:MAG: hypothetical protein WKF89_15715 [Chitinophagaceae bacterium]